MRFTALPLLLLTACPSTPADPDPTSTTGTTAADPTSTTGTTTDPTTTDADGTTTAPTTGDSTSTGEPTPDYEQPGPYGVGVSAYEIPGADERTIRITVWYPSDTPSDEVPLPAVIEPANAAALEDLLTMAPAGCTRPAMAATLDAPLAEGSFPGVIFSHCLSCLGISSAHITERLASHGFVVAGVTHTGDTLFEQQQGMVAPLEDAWLAVRAQDVALALDDLLAREPYGPAIDPAALGIFGHSYGAATTGRVLQDDDRFIAGVAIAAPVANPLLPSVALASIAEPMLLLLAQEDNSITELGNDLMRGNAMDLPGGSWLVELRDAGHWSFSDLCGIVDAFQPGCGDGIRQTVPGEPFTYLDNEVARGIGAAYTTAYFALHLQGDVAAEDYLNVASPADVVTVVRHEP